MIGLLNSRDVSNCFKSRRTPNFSDRMSCDDENAQPWRVRSAHATRRAHPK